MKRDEIIKLAREAGIRIVDYAAAQEGIVKFVKLIAAAEREACAKVCEGLSHLTAEQCATAIRMRGER